MRFHSPSSNFAIRFQRVTVSDFTTIESVFSFSYEIVSLEIIERNKIYKNNKTLVERNLKSKRADKATSTKLMKKESERVRAPSNLLLVKSFLCF